VLQRNGKLYGALNALEDSDSKCWNSDQGDNQFFVMKFGRPVQVQEVKIQFQAGFASEIIRVHALAGGVWSEVDELEPEDALGLQSFVLEDPKECSEFRLEFEDCKDFYGRITVYTIQTWGHECSRDAGGTPADSK
jgi:hypothetical protein